MLVVKVELHSARTGEIEELARMLICNDARRSLENPRRGTYNCYSLRKGSDPKNAEVLRKSILRRCTLQDFPRSALHVWNMVAEALTGMNYGRTSQLQQCLIDRSIEKHLSEQGDGAKVKS